MVNTKIIIIKNANSLCLYFLRILVNEVFILVIIGMCKIKYIRYMLLLLLLLASSVGATAASADQVVVTSGRVVYDPFGRAVAVYHPTVDRRADVTVYSDTVDSEPPTVTEYDVLDRPVRVTYPDSTITETAYGVADHVQVATVTDALGNVSKTHVDGSGRTVKSTSKDRTMSAVRPRNFSSGICAARTAPRSWFPGSW